MKVIITTPSFGKFHENLEDSFVEKGIELLYLIPFDRERLLEEVTDADVLVVGLEPIDKKVLRRSSSLKLVAKHGVGVDNIDIEAAEEQGVAVTNTPNTNNDAVADLAFGLMLSAARKIVDANNRVKNGEWPRYDGYSVWGKTLGIVGLGSIGKGVAKRANGFNLNILGFDTGDKTAEEEELNVQRVPFDELISQSDYISLHVPLNEQSRHMIGKEQFEKMKRNAILINTARGGIVDEDTLNEALSKQWIGDVRWMYLKRSRLIRIVNFCPTTT